MAFVFRACWDRDLDSFRTVFCTSTVDTPASRVIKQDITRNNHGLTNSHRFAFIGSSVRVCCVVLSNSPLASQWCGHTPAFLYHNRLHPVARRNLSVRPYLRHLLDLGEMSQRRQAPLILSRQSIVLPLRMGRIGCHLLPLRSCR